MSIYINILLYMEHPHRCITHKDKKNLQSQATYFHEYVYSTATSFGSMLGGPSLGHSNIRNSIHTVTKTH